MTALKRFFGEGFRVFFLAAGLFAILAMSAWVLFIAAQAGGRSLSAPPFALVPQYWHGHEMIFGYATAAMAGFFLTAVPNWTGAKHARQGFIAAASGIWLIGRGAMWYAGVLPAGLVAVADLAFLPIIAAKIATQLVRRPKPANVMFLGLLVLLWSANLFVHLDWTGAAPGLAATGLRAGLFALCAFIAVLGGRVTPAFTRNAMLRAGIEDGLPATRRIDDRVAIAACIALPLAELVGLDTRATGVLAVLAGGAILLRGSGWRIGFARTQPILWSLHLSHGLVGLGLVLSGLARLGLGSEVAALHLTGIGGIGGMTLAVMSRATLGHTGRALVAPKPVVVAYVLVPFAALLRWVDGLLPGAWHFPILLAAAGLWVIAFAAYTFALWPAFWGPRQSREDTS